MAYRRSTQHRGSPTATLDSRRYPLRRSPPHKPLAAVTTRNSSLSSIASSEARPVLVPLHPNLRRLPSRLFVPDKEIEMRDTDVSIAVGSKRKRVVSRNENAHGHGRAVRGERRLKRLRSGAETYRQDSSEESAVSTMDVDMTNRWSASEESGDDDLDDPSAEDSTDDYLINSAPFNQLQRLRKDELVRLYTSAGLLGEAESLTKHEIVEAIISARDDMADLPPSSPPRGDADSSDCSSDDGNVAGDEETDFGSSRRFPQMTGLRRRATINDLGRQPSRPLKSRSLSMGYFNDETGDTLPSTRASKVKTGSKHSAGLAGSRRRTVSQTSSRSSTRSVYLTSTVQSPPATRTRSRKVSAPTEPLTPISPTSNGSSVRGHAKGKGRAKQVEFSNPVHTRVKASSRLSAKNERRRQHEPEAPEEESDLTELDELDDELVLAANSQPSPRRLRSKGKESDCEGSIQARTRKPVEDDSSWDATRRVTPMRKAKIKIGCLKEDSTADEAEDECDSSSQHENELDADEEEVDELVSSASTTPPPARGRRTPVKRRLRPRRVQTFTPPSDGDDEGSAEDDDEEQEDVGSDEERVDDEESVDGNVEIEDDEETIAVEPRRLRNGKIVGEEDIDMDAEESGEEDEEEEAADEEGQEDMDEVAEAEIECEEDSAEDPELDAEGDIEEDEPMEEEVDLMVATAKTLVRLRRDDLVRLCETRNLDVAGTKPQLAEALLEWRDRHTNEFSSPSSAGTVRPPSTIKRRRHKHGRTSAQDPTTPVLERSDRVHLDEPRTPPISESHRQKEPEPELELDLESLGLEDREIPYDRLTKLEKIGSGGFKDVFIGKFKGRKIAISEFRGQLSAMDIKELKLLGGFNHPNIVRFLGVSIPENTKETPVMIVSELCSNGDLFDYIRNISPPPTLRKVLSIMLDIARGLEYLHLRKPSVIHRDCKSSNILITSKGTAKIADFGLAKVKQSTRSMVRSLVGTVNWQAPELWHAHPKYNHKVDVFSCAMVYWEMLQWHLPNKKFPWEGMNEHAIYEIVGAKRQRPSISGLRKVWCPEIVDLVERMWAQEHQDRPTMSEVVEALEELVHGC